MRIVDQLGFTNDGYHSQLIKIAVVGIILGVVFLVFWQAVLSTAAPATWDETYCRRLLGQYDSLILTDVLSEERNDSLFRLAGVFADGYKTVEMRGTDHTVGTCAISIVSDQPVGGGFANDYACTLATVRYKSENRTDWLMAGIQTELIPDLVVEGIPRYSTFIIYYNPAARAAYDALLAKLAAQECEL